MKQSMQNEPSDILFKCQRFGIARLIICGLRRDKNIAEIKPVSLERQHIGGFIHSSVLRVVTAHHLVVYQHDRKRPILNGKLRYQQRNKSTEIAAIDRMRSLLIDENVFSLRLRRFV